ncbi:MAG: 6-carboxyhexanoate--CoA ligase [Clostridiales bacterium]|nr:6-carboxyhexanoate--CoA ligase [Clostridiales bacterium]
MYSIKMRASEAENHISGAEKIVPEGGIIPVVDSLIERGMHHAKGEADFVNIKIEKIREEEIQYLDALPVSSAFVIKNCDCFFYNLRKNRLTNPMPLGIISKV